MRPIKAAFACLLLAIVVVLCLNAQPTSAPIPAAPPAQSSVTAATADAAVAQTTESQSEVLPPAAPKLFTVLGLPVTNSMVCTWIVAVIILVVVRVGTWKNIKEVPSGLQNVIETLVEGWENLIGDILDQRVARWVFPFATTFFIFIVISNFVDLVPGVGSIGFGTPDKHSALPFAIEKVQTPFFRPPTTDANLTVAMAGIFLIMSLYWAVRYNGPWGLVKHIFGVKMDTNKWVYPLFFLLFLFIGAMELLSVTFARPVALAMRLYGNIFAGESILDMIYHNHLPVAIAPFIVLLFIRNFCLLGAGVCVCHAGRGVRRHALHPYRRGARPLI